VFGFQGCFEYNFSGRQEGSTVSFGVTREEGSATYTHTCLINENGKTLTN